MVLTVPTCGEALSRRGHLVGRLDRGREHVDRIRPGGGIAPQVEIGRDQFDFGTAEIHRVEIEAEEIEQRQAGDGDAERRDDDRDAVAFQEIVDRRQRGNAERVLLAGRVEHVEQRRQHRDAGDVGDQHSDAGDLAEFRYAAIGRRQEREEAGRDRGGGQRQRDPCPRARLHQRRAEIGLLEALLAIADAELNAEIDAQADEQHGEGDRDEVERPDHQQSQRRGDRQADEQRDDHRHDDPERPQRHPEDQEHHREGDRAVDRRAFPHRREFFVLDRHRAGQAHPRLEARREVEARRPRS